MNGPTLPSTYQVDDQGGDDEGEEEVEMEDNQPPILGPKGEVTAGDRGYDAVVQHR